MSVKGLIEIINFFQSSLALTFVFVIFKYDLISNLKMLTSLVIHFCTFIQYLYYVSYI